MRFQRRFVLLVATGLFMAAALGAAGYAASRPDVSSANVDVLRTRSSSKSLGHENDRGKYFTVVSVTLPAGSWVLTANATAENYGNGDIVRCGVYRDDTALGTAQTLVGSTLTPIAGLNPIGAYSSSASATASLPCEHVSLIDGIVIDHGAVLWAHRSSSLNHD